MSGLLPVRSLIEQGNTVQKAELLRSASRSTSLVESTIDLSIKELRDQIIMYCRAGRAVKIDGLGIWTPSVALDGLTTEYLSNIPTLSMR